MLDLTYEELKAQFPFVEMRPAQDLTLRKIVTTHGGGLVAELPTGVGKTGIGVAFLKALAARPKKPGVLIYSTTTKTQIDQLQRLFPGLFTVVLGRSSYPCLYYERKGVPDVNAADSPCYMLDCAHRVDPETGKTQEEGVEPCPYFQAKFEARQKGSEGGIVLCTTAFLIRNRLSVKEWREQDPVVVLDEAHRLPKVTRSLFEYSLTDKHMSRVSKLLRGLDKEQHKVMQLFRTTFVRIARMRTHGSRRPTLLKEEDVAKLIEILEQLDTGKVEKAVRKAVREGTIDPIKDKGDLKALENISLNIPRLVRSLRYSVEEKDKKPLNYVMAVSLREPDEEAEPGKPRRARFRLTIKAYYVAPIIRKAVGPNYLAYSATIGQGKIFEYESGLRGQFMSLESSFSAANTRVYIPSDTPDLSMKKRKKGDLGKALKMIATSAGKFAKAGKRSLVVVISEDERALFQEIAARPEHKLDVLTYGDGKSAKEAATEFVRGRGDVLLGTAGQYSEGVDLPAGIAPVIFFLRPGFQRPDDPETQFEERRFSEGHCWSLWNWRVMMEALQVRGRNIRSEDDLGVCIFVSQQFRRFLFQALPQWMRLRPTYRNDLTMDKAVEDTLRLLAGKKPVPAATT